MANYIQEPLLDLTDGRSLDRITRLVDQVGVTLRPIVTLNKVGLQIKETNRNVVEAKVCQVKGILSTGSTVDNSTVVRIPELKVVLGHVDVHILSSLGPSLAKHTLGLEAHDVKAVLLAVLEFHPLTTGSVTAIFLAGDALVGDETEAGCLHDVVGDLGLDAVGDGADEYVDGLGGVVEEEPAAVEEAGDLVVDPGAVLVYGGEGVDGFDGFTLCFVDDAGSETHGFVNLVGGLGEEVGESR